MKREFYYYACPKNRITNSNQMERTSKKGDRTLYACALVVLLIFSLPMMLTNTLLWIVCFVIYASVCLLNKKDKDPYSQCMLLYGMSMCYLYVHIVYAFFLVANIVFFGTILFVVSFVAVFFYEIGVFINVFLKRYSKKHKKTYVAPTTISIFAPLMGFQLARLLGVYSWKTYILILMCALVFVFAFSFIQKYIIYKIFKNTNIDIDFK